VCEGTASERRGCRTGSTLPSARVWRLSASETSVVCEGTRSERSKHFFYKKMFRLPRPSKNKKTLPAPLANQITEMLFCIIEG
jgi:hypothetical protein